MTDITSLLGFDNATNIRSYLSFKLYTNQMGNSFDQIVNKMNQKLSGWKVKFLSILQNLIRGCYKNDINHYHKYIFNRNKPRIIVPLT